MTLCSNTFFNISFSSLSLSSSSSNSRKASLQTRRDVARLTTWAPTRSSKRLTSCSFGLYLGLRAAYVFSFTISFVLVVPSAHPAMLSIVSMTAQGHPAGRCRPMSFRPRSPLPLPNRPTLVHPSSLAPPRTNSFSCSLFIVPHQRQRPDHSLACSPQVFCSSLIPAACQLPPVTTNFPPRRRLPSACLPSVMVS